MISPVPNQTSAKFETPTQMSIKTSAETSIGASATNPASQPYAPESRDPWDRPGRKPSPAERREAKEKARIKRQVVEKLVAHRLGLRDQVFARGLRAIINRNLDALVSEMIADASKKSKYITTRSIKKV